MLNLIALIFPVCGVVLAKDKVYYLKKFGLFFLVGMGSSLIPFLHFGVLLGFPSYTLCAAFLAMVTHVHFGESDVEVKNMQGFTVGYKQSNGDITDLYGKRINVDHIKTVLYERD
jgi:hypothetical protein